MKIRTGRLILLVLISFSMVCNDLMASSFLARPGYGVTTGHEFDPLHPDSQNSTSNRVTVVPPPPPIGKHPNKVSPNAKRRPVVVVSPPAEFAPASRAISQSAPIPKKPLVTVPIPSRAAPPIIVKPPKPPIVVGRPLGTPPPRGPNSTIVSPPDPVLVTVKTPAAQSQKATGLIAVSAPERKTTVAPSLLSPSPALKPTIAETTSHLVPMPVSRQLPSEPEIVPAPGEVKIASPVKAPTLSESQPSAPAKQKFAGESPRNTIATDSRAVGIDITTAPVNQGSMIYGITSFDSGLHVETTTDLQGIAVEPGKTFSVSFRVTNTSGKAGKFIEDFDMPQGFELAFPPAEFSLEPMESFNSIVMISAPSDLSAGEHRFAYNVFDPNNQAVRGSLSFSFNIKAITRLEFIIEDQPGCVIDGESFVIKGKLFNYSNATFTVGLSMTQQKNFKVQVKPERAVMAPGDFIDLKIAGKTNGRSMGMAVNTYLIVKDLLRRNDNALLRQYINLNFYNLANRKIDFAKKLPIVATMRVAGNDDETHSQLELKGRGALDSEGRRRVDFLVREKPSRLSPFNRDEMRLQYTGENAGIKVGDHGFGISPLFSSIGGRGVGFDVGSSKTTSFGAVDYRSRFTDIPLEGKGFYIAHKLNQRSALRLNYLSTTSDKYPLSPDEKFTTLAFTFRPDKSSTFRGEVGRKWGGELTDKRNAVFSINYATRIRDLAMFNVSHTDSGVIYAGGLVGNENTSTSLNVPISKKISTNLVYVTAKQNPLVIENGTSASKSDNLQAMLNYRMNRYRDLSLSFNDNHRTDWISSKYNEREKGVQARISQSWNSLRVNYSLNRNKWVDQLRGLGRWHTIHSMSSSYHGSENLMFSAYGSYARFGNDEEVISPDNNNYGMRVDWGMLENLRMSLNYSETIYQKSGLDSSRLGLNFSYQYFTSSVDFNVTSSRSERVSQAPLYYELTVSQQLGVPVSRNIKIGALTGVVTEVVGSATLPVTNVALLIDNMAAITDARGRYVFADLRPGTYTLDLDRRATGINKISSVGLPTAVYIAGAKLAVLNLHLEEACSVVGEVVVSAERLPDGLTGLGNILADNIIAPMSSGVKKLYGQKLSGVVVEIKRGEKIQRTVTNNYGGFSFAGIESGVWNYRVLQNSIPDGYTIDRTEGVIKLTPESKARLDFTVSAIARTIEMVGGD